MSAKGTAEFRVHGSEIERRQSADSSAYVRFRQNGDFVQPDVDATLRPAARQSCRVRSNSATLGRDVIGAATKSSSSESRTTVAGRIFEPRAWWNSTSIRTTSPN